MNGPSMPEDLVDRLQQLRARADAMPGAPDVFPVVAARKHRRRVIRRFQVASLILVVVASTAGTTYVLARAFGVGKSQPNVTPFIRHGPRPRNGLIAYVSKAEGTSDIWVVGPDGTGNRNLEALSTTDFGPAWSPDGRLIAFSQWGAGTRGISVMRADGSNVHRLTSGHSDYGAAWSPDGKRIAFRTTRGESPAGVDPSNIFVINVDRSGERQLTPPRGAAAAGRSASLASARSGHRTARSSCSAPTASTAARASTTGTCSSWMPTAPTSAD